MNTQKIFATSLIFIILLSTTVVALGVTSPVPKGMKLLRGESSTFEFEIQAVTSADDMVCTYSMTEMAPIAVAFDSDQVTVKAGTIETVYGEVTVPADTPFKTYTAELIVSCGAKSASESGSEVKTTIGGSTLSIDVVEFREEAKKEAEIPSQIPMNELMLLIIILIIILGGYYLYRKKSSKGKKRK